MGTFLDYRHFAAKAPEHLREFESDVAAAYDDQMTWKDLELEDRRVGQVGHRVDAGHVRNVCPAAHVEKDLVRGNEVVAHAERVWRLKTRVTFIYGAIL